MNERYRSNQFLTQLYEQIQPEESLLTCEKGRMEQVRKEKISILKDVLALEKEKQYFDMDLSYELDSQFESMGVVIDKYVLKNIKGLDYPVYHIKPDKPKKKTVLYLHGHDDLGIMGALLYRTDKVRYHKMIPLKLALQGYDVIAPELLGYGEAGFYGFPKNAEQMSGCFINGQYLALAGFSLGGFRVYQAMKTIDFIEQLGLAMEMTAFGISGGGMICQHLSVVEERVKNVLVACYANTYKNSILYKEHCSCNYVPGLLRIGDSYQMLALAAPKPMFTVNGAWDRAFPEAGSHKAFEYLEKVYERLGASDKYEWKLFEGKHEIKEELILDWLERWA